MKTVLQWAEHLLAALDHLIEKGIIHRDLKPDNVFVTKDFVLKVGDFGSAREASRTDTFSNAGSPLYMSPEAAGIFQAMKVTHKSDLYAVGLILWEIIERRRVFSNLSAAESREDTAEISAPNCQHPIREIIINCAQRDYEKRPNPQDVYREIQRHNRMYTRDNAYPVDDIEQRTLLHPIGFDGTENRIPLFEEFNLTPWDLPSTDRSYIALDLPENDLEKTGTLCIDLECGGVYTESLNPGDILPEKLARITAEHLLCLMKALHALISSKTKKNKTSLDNEAIFRAEFASLATD
ncbi:unnamed protein product, partial [Mesorhabditis belari]|uniref:Protein kinase domain-containing protein n=1 Tax=Mesorhabditis belari TaxID=2138241 RepID=A0AAF3F3M8_9BILA